MTVVIIFSLLFLYTLLPPVYEDYQKSNLHFKLCAKIEAKDTALGQPSSITKDALVVLERSLLMLLL